jgi:hypothetical protein
MMKAPKQLSRALLAMLAAATILVSACKKSAGEKAQASLLTASPWTVRTYEWRTTAGAWGASASWANPYFYPDHVLAFADNGTFTDSKGGSGVAASGTWLLSGDRKKLTIVWHSGSTRVIDVSSLTGRAMEFSGTLDEYTVGSGADGTYTYTYYDAWRITLSH